MKQRAAILFGGQSSEHSISCVSAAGVLGAIDREQFDVVAVGITPSGTWLRVSDDPRDWKSSDGVLPSVSEDGVGIQLVARTRIADDSALPDDVVAVDVAFPVMHGQFGEDGTIQGALEVLGIPYVGSGVLASAAGMDKQATKVFLEAAGLPVGPYVVFARTEWDQAPAEVQAKVESLKFPVFVKPARAGSSVGITKVQEIADLQVAADLALEHDDKVIVEQSIENAREVECAVLEAQGVSGATASRCAEIVVGGEHEFYDYDAKYRDNDVELIVPADLPDALHDQLGKVAIKAFGALGCRGLARVDFFVTEDGEFVINEVNTMPGFTAVSLYPRMSADAGVSFEQLVDRLLSLALIPTVGPR